MSLLGTSAYGCGEMGKRRILIVEDEAIIAKDIQNILKNFGYSFIDLASSGEESVKKAENLHPALVLMDIRIKGHMNGIEAARRIYHSYKIPVVYLTAYNEDRVRSDENAGLKFDFIPKPFGERDIENILKKYLPHNN